MDSSKI